MIEPSESEVQAAMLPCDRNDFHEARARLIRERKIEATKQAAIAAAAAAAPPWRVEPTDDEIRYRMSLRGGFYEDCRRTLLAELVAEAKRLDAVLPDAADEISTAQAIADTASASASRIREKHQAIVNHLEQLIFSLANLRKEISCVLTLRPDKSALSSMADRAIGYHIASRLSGRTEENVSGFAACTNQIAISLALEPYIEGVVASRESRASELVKEIRDFASANNVAIGNFLVTLRKEANRLNNGRTFDLDLCHGLT